MIAFNKAHVHYMYQESLKSWTISQFDHLKYIYCLIELQKAIILYNHK